jgi:hypothetical protein
MARREIDPLIGNDRVGLMITRGQVEHLGHVALKAQMMLDNGRNIIGFGSSQKSGVLGNPLTPDQKRRAQLGAWGGRVPDRLPSGHRGHGPLDGLGRLRV